MTVAEPARLELRAQRRGIFHRRRSNRRTAVQGHSPLLLVMSGLSAAGRGALAVGRVLGKLLVVLAVLAGAGLGGRWAIHHVVESPRFQLQQIELSPSSHIRRDELLALAKVQIGDKLLGIDTDAVASRVAAHPWVERVRVSRQLPSGLRIDVSERNAVALASLGGLYLVDANGRPFKRARMDEADGLPVLTGIERGQYVELREVSEAVFREAIGIAEEYRRRPGRPGLSEVSFDPRYGFTLFLLDAGTEIRLGRGEYSKKLARLDQIFEAVSTAGLGGPTAVRIVNLDDLGGGRVPVLLRNSEQAPADTAKTTPARIAKN